MKDADEELRKMSEQADSIAADLQLAAKRIEAMQKLVRQACLTQEEPKAKPKLQARES